MQPPLAEPLIARFGYHPGDSMLCPPVPLCGGLGVGTCLLNSRRPAKPCPLEGSDLLPLSAMKQCRLAGSIIARNFVLGVSLACGRLWAANAPQVLLVLCSYQVLPWQPACCDRCPAAVRATAVSPAVPAAQQRHRRWTVQADLMTGPAARAVPSQQHPATQLRPQWQVPPCSHPTAPTTGRRSARDWGYMAADTDSRCSVVGCR